MMFQSMRATLTQTHNTMNKNNNGRHYPSQPTKVMRRRPHFLKTLLQTGLHLQNTQHLRICIAWQW